MILWDVVEEHLDDAEFLWAQWERSLVSPVHSLAEVALGEEERLLANLDGLVVGGEPVRARLLVPALESDLPALRSAAALALLLSGDGAAAAPVLALLRDEDPRRRASASRALGLARVSGVDEALLAVLHDAPPTAQAAALEALAIRRTSPGPALSGLRPGDHPALLSAAYRCASASVEKLPAGLLVESLTASDPSLRDAALAAGLVLGLPQAWTTCQKLVRRGHADALPGDESLPLLFAATLGEVREVEPLVNATSSPALRRAAVWALGYSGRVSAAETCLTLLADPEVGRLAGEAFAAITGLPVTAPLTAAEGESDDTPVLPRLDAAAVEAWWGANRARFERGRRYLSGLPWGRESVLSLLARGPMRRRRGVALEVAVRTRGRVQVETTALTARQEAELRGAAALQEGDLERAFS